MEGIINILKPPGMTSHDVVSFLRRTLGEKKIGHCGTLDPQAAGVLPICLGQATRLAEYLSGGDKRYYCEMTTGYETDTQDIWGNTIWRAPDGNRDISVASDKVAEALGSFVGDILQEVPAYSAIKREGKSLHQYAREGTFYTGITRSVSIRSIEIVKIDPGRIKFIIECGGGTYVRMLCRDLGRKLGCGGVMSFLLRLSVGQFRLEDSTTLEEIRIGKDSGNPLDDRIQPKEAALDGLPRIAVSEEQAVKIRHGQPLWLPVDGIASQGTAWTFDDITSRDTVWTSNSIASRNTVWTSSGIASRDTVWTSDGIASWDTVWTSSGIASQNTAWTSDGITNRDTVWTSDDKQRLVALGHMTAGDGSRDGQALFRPDKVFSV